MPTFSYSLSFEFWFFFHLSFNYNFDGIFVLVLTFLQQRGMQVWTQAFLRTRISLTNWYIPIKLSMQHNLQCIKLCRQVKWTDMSISYQRPLKPNKCHKTVEFRFEVFVFSFRYR